MNIKSIHAREILDSRGDPTVQTTVTLDDGATGSFSVPSGASTGVHEAWELRDGDKKRFFGKGVLKACENVNVKIANHLQGRDVFDQKMIDHEMIKLDGDPQKKNLGANAILSVSIACAKAAAQSRKMPLYIYLRELFDGYHELEGYLLPVPMFNVINGGAHADNNLDCQEFMIGPVGAGSVREAVRMGSEVFHNLEKILKSMKESTNVGNEGGFAPSIDSGLAPNLDSDEEALVLLKKAIETAGYTYGTQIGVGADVAASEFFEKGQYHMTFGGKERALTTEQMVDFIKAWVEKYKLIVVEDGAAEDDLAGWKKLNELFGSTIQIVGDDFLVTNKKRLQMAIDNQACNTVLIKVNQIGTLSETFETIALAYQNKIQAFVSHRSGETTDTFVADLAVAVNATRLKSGAPSRGERVCKYNRLMEIEDELKADGMGRYSGL